VTIAQAPGFANFAAALRAPPVPAGFCGFQRHLIADFDAHSRAAALDSLSATRLSSNLNCSIYDHLFEYRTNIGSSARFSGAPHAPTLAPSTIRQPAITGDIS
jgi:hypothetical protein